MGQCYNHLAIEQRVQIYTYWKLGYSKAQIARFLKVNRSTISRELSWLEASDRNEESLVLARRAQEAAEASKSVASRGARLKKEDVWSFVREKLQNEKWSPECISGWLKENMPLLFVSHQAIYDYIEQEHPELKKYLRRKGKQRKRPGGKKQRHKKKILHAVPKTSIHERPSEADERTEMGHWEIDLVGSQSPSTILILLERVSRVSILVKVPNKLAETIRRAVYEAFKDLPPELRKTLTYDNGSENALHYELDRELGLSSFFCEPYHSWEKGSVENRIGVLRMFFPKGTNFDNVPEEQVALVEYMLNHRPMKLHNYQFPAVIFENALAIYTKKAA